LKLGNPLAPADWLAGVGDKPARLPRNEPGAYWSPTPEIASDGRPENKAGVVDRGIPNVASEPKRPPGDGVLSLASPPSRLPSGIAGLAGGRVDDHGNSSRPRVGGLDPAGIGHPDGGFSAAKLLLEGNGLKSGRFGGSHAIAPTRSAGIIDQ
jgi:hypothetical protein